MFADYDYLVINASEDEDSKEILFIDNDDLMEIAPKVFEENSGFEIADDYTIVFPKLEGNAWKKFVELAREKNHDEIMNLVPAAQTVNLTSNYNPEETEADDEKSYQCHGDHWDCVFTDSDKEFATTLPAAIENGELVGHTETDYILGEEEAENYHGKVFELEYSKQKDEPLVVRTVVAALNDSNVVVSMYPVVKDGNVLSLKIVEINEWENGLEAWIKAELQMRDQ